MSDASGKAEPAAPGATGAAVARWFGPDGAPVACREKLRVLDENQAEVEQVLRDAFEDAVLMGVDPERMRALLLDTVRALRGPHRPGPDR